MPALNPQAVIRAVETCPFPDLPLEIRTDSQYTIGCECVCCLQDALLEGESSLKSGMTVWLPGWMRNRFRTTTGPVKNADMVKHLIVLLRRRRPDARVKFAHVKGHAGEEGNEAADVGAVPGNLC